MIGLNEVIERIRQLYGELRANLFLAEIDELSARGYDKDELERFLVERMVIWFFLAISAIRRSKLTLNEFDRSDRFFFARHEWIVDILSKDLPPGSKVLEVGCGRGLNLCELALRGYEAYGVDISEEMLSVAKRLAEKTGCNVNLKKIDGISLPFGDASFDAVIYVWTIHELKADDLPITLDEAKRVTKPGGFVYVIDQELVAPFSDVKQLAQRIRLSLEDERQLLKVYDHGISSYALFLKFRA